MLLLKLAAFLAAAILMVCLLAHNPLTAEGRHANLPEPDKHGTSMPQETIDTIDTTITLVKPITSLVRVTAAPSKAKPKEVRVPVAETIAKGTPAPAPLPGGGSMAGVHVCFCSDDTDWRPLSAAINSTLRNAKRPKSIVFHLITSPDLAPVLSETLMKILPLAGQLKTHVNPEVEAHIKSLISYRKSSGARKGLASTFNFAPFYLEDFLGGDPNLKRLIYLDTDVILVDDIERLWKVDLKGAPAAAVQDCSQTFDIYIDFDEMAELGLKSEGLNPKECVFNRGVFVMDLGLWKRMRITKDIEHWMTKYKESKKDIYKFGMSQPPWLLALHKRYRKLGAEWNCRGLGRETLSLKELKELKSQLQLDFKALQKVGARAMGDQAQPYIASCSRSAMLLHFNGKLKPWRSQRWARKAAPMCLVPPKTPVLQKKTVADLDFARCADIWSNYLSLEAIEVLNSTANLFYHRE